MKRPKPTISPRSVYANIAWRVNQGGEEEITCRVYRTLTEQESDRTVMDAEGWEICPSMGLFWRTTIPEGWTGMPCE